MRRTASGPERLEEVPDLAQDRRWQQRAFRMPQEACLAGVILDVPLPQLSARPGGQ